MLIVFISNKSGCLGNHNLFALYVLPYVTHPMTTM
ncbi:hypothetical protein T11_5327 [Trichinella zimbabwensis]|uniref:Uncharacterized protein n=1 Tax=Trichinella zimbabwensis TaxID=268475 RepID=A0A0V1GI92_9BILA|nr:hypothetical protein T11_3086 [Trichinella zimbabwensis]KRY97368.1 hypothetical protein T11_15372 [Trichinella zimbabwensis]KRY97746.1 hypothetical protein T11_5327 [Trichinella zimbabwensis]